MIRYPEPRSARRFLKREAERAKLGERQQQKAEADKLAEKMRARGYRDPDADRRWHERRSQNLTGEALERKLQELGRVDQRRAQRRSGGDRRHR